MSFLKVSGICAILAPIVILSSILLSIQSYPSFMIAEQWLSDLGVSPVSVIFNSGLVIGGLLAIGFAYGLRSLKELKLGVWASPFVFVVGLSIIGVGLFPTGGIFHTVFAVILFTSMAISLLYTGVSLYHSEYRYLSTITLVLTVFSLISIRFLEYHGIAELMVGVPLAIWCILIGVIILKH